MSIDAGRIQTEMKGMFGTRDISARADTGMVRSGGVSRSSGFEGDPGEVRSRRGRALALARRNGGLALGGSPGRAWLTGRFQAPYLRDELLTHGVMVETLETATRWSNVGRLHDAVTGAIEHALRRSEGRPVWSCVTYRTCMRRARRCTTRSSPRQRDGAEIEQWRAVKRGGERERSLTGGGTITHHHAVGRDHAPWLAREVGDQRRSRRFRALKAELEPGRDHEPRQVVAGRFRLRINCR